MTSVKLSRDFVHSQPCLIHTYYHFHNNSCTKLEKKAAIIFLSWITLISENVPTGGNVLLPPPTPDHFTSLTFDQQPGARDGGRCVCFHWVTDGKEKVKRRFKWRSCCSLSVRYLLWCGGESVSLIQTEPLLSKYTVNKNNKTSDCRIV